MSRKYGFDTLSLRAGYTTDIEQHSVTPPIYLTNAYGFESTEDARQLFSLEKVGNIYSRIQNPTNDVLEKRIAALEGGVGALSFSSGHAAIALTMLNLAKSGEEILSSQAIYGGAINMLGVSFEKLGIKVRFFNPDNLDEMESFINDKTKAIFTELIGNPNANIADIEKMAEIAHSKGIPFIVDSTFTTPYLCRPFEFGADIVIHSATKFLGGHGTVMSGLVVDSGNFNWLDNPRFPEFNTPDNSYHGVVYAKDFGNAAFITKLRVQMMRDFGSCASPFNSFMILQGIETLSLRMRKHCDNALVAAKFLEENLNVEYVNYPGLKSNKYYPLAQKYTPNGAGAIFTFGLKGGKKAGEKLINSFKLFMNVANVGDARSLAIHPASTTHSQLSPKQLKDAGIDEGTVRLSVGIEDINDILDDLENAINSSKL